MRFKRVMLMLLITCIAFASMACGSTSETGTYNSENTTQEETSDESDAVDSEELSIGETVSTDEVEFKLLDFQLTTAVSLEESDDYYQPVAYEYDGYGFRTDSDHVLAYISLKIQNIGKTDITGASRETPDGGSLGGVRGVSDLIDIDYDDGYMYMGNSYCKGVYDVSNGYTYSRSLYGESGATMSEDHSLNLKIRTEAKEIICYFLLPYEIMENEDIPLKLVVYLPSSDAEYDTISFTYKIR